MCHLSECIYMRSETVETSPRGGARASIQIAMVSPASSGRPLVIFPFYEFADDVDPVCGGLEALVDIGGGEFSEIRSRNAARTIPWADSLQDRPDPCKENTQRTDVVVTFVYDFEYREVFNFRAPDDRRITLGLK
jgi:hypothetical protein